MKMRVKGLERLKGLLDRIKPQEGATRAKGFAKLRGGMLTRLKKYVNND